MEWFYSYKDDDGKVQVAPDDIRHMHVMRKKAGDQAYLVDGKGNRHTIVLKSIKRGHVDFDILETKRFERLAGPTIIICPTKQASKLEFFLEKAVEIGIRRIIPMRTSHSERKNLKIDRLERNAIAAMKQSQRAWVPQIEKLQNFEEIAIRKFTNCDKYIAVCDYENPIRLREIAQSDKKSVIMVGPEGGFSDEEIDFATKMKWKKVLLGSNRMRTETAGIVACAMLQFDKKEVLNKKKKATSTEEASS